jgi:peptide deformylase
VPGAFTTFGRKSGLESARAWGLRFSRFALTGFAFFMAPYIPPRSPAKPPVAVDRAARLPYFTRVKKLEIITLPDRKLRAVSAAVERVDDDARRFMDDMLATMYEAPGIGLAAVQVGVPRRIVVLDVAKREEEGAEPHPMFLVNPEILSVSDDRAIREEGCLSIPEYYAEVERPASVRVRFLDREGKRQEMEANGILATCLQHEIDHLDGKLFIDYLSKLKRDMVIKRFTKQARQDVKAKAL